MNDIEITPALLADIEDKCKRLIALKELETTAYHDYWLELITPDNTLGPAVVLAMIGQITFLHTLLFGDMLPPDDPIFRAEELDKEVKDLRAEVERLRAAQCWVIVNKETKATFLGPFFTKAHANDKLGSMPFEYAKNYEVQPWKGSA